jgi:hypothetical protein
MIALDHRANPILAGRVYIEATVHWVLQGKRCSIVTRPLSCSDYQSIQV